jgi:hypothetical protein
MMMRMLILILALGSRLTSPLFASTERGNSLLQEGGGSIGIAGVAGPAGAPGLAGAAGAQGIPGIPGIPGAPGILDYADFFALQGTDNGTIFGGSAINFPNNGSISTGIVRTGPSTFQLSTIGTYLVQFQVGVVQGAQLQLALNGSPLSETVVGRATGTTQIIGASLVTTLTPNSILQVINPLSNIAINLEAQGVAGTQFLSAHLVIIRIQ